MLAAGRWRSLLLGCIIAMRDRLCVFFLIDKERQSLTMYSLLSFQFIL